MKRFLESLTLLQLTLLGFAAVILPLATAIWIAVVRSEEFASTSRDALVSLQSSTDTSRLLANRINSLERSARQFFALEDPQIHALYEGHRREFLQLLRSMNEMAPVDGVPSALAELRDADLRLHRYIEMITEAMSDTSDAANRTSAPTEGPASLASAEDPRTSTTEQGTARLLAEDVEALFDILRRKSAELIALHSRRGQELSNALPRQASSLRNSLVLLAALVIPLSLMLAAVFLVLIRRPLRELDSSIRTLGDGVLAKPVRIGGARDLVELGQRLDWLRERLGILESQKTRFLRDVSHELKTPLTNIREASELLLDASNELKEAETATITRILHDNGLRLQSLIEELLRFGAADGSSVQHKPLALHALLETVAKRQAIAAQGRRLDLRLTLEAVCVLGNTRQLEIIVDNLLSNAIKFARLGGCVDVALTRDGNEVMLDVKDDGPGVPKEHQHRVFEWFFRGGGDTHALVSGSGMGLAIAHEYAGMHGGTLTLLPCDNGALFRLALPALELSHSLPRDELAQTPAVHGARAPHAVMGAT